ncbi:MAG: helix-turn-helix transcriptional regulator [Clostridia bacterium]|nr:helix-turn-helix transcriptional regulator [Clostridia bacterium]
MKKLSQQKLGELLGFSARTVSDWECGNTEPDIKTIKSITIILEVSLEELFDF